LRHSLHDLGDSRHHDGEICRGRTRRGIRNDRAGGDGLERRDLLSGGDDRRRPGAHRLTPELTEELIAEGMARAKKVACRGEGRCFAMPHILPDALATCTPKGRCTVGGTRRVIVTNGGREAYDVWLDVHTGEGHLRRRRD
jgi:hypothetical protein